MHGSVSVRDADGYVSSAMQRTAERDAVTMMTAMMMMMMSERLTRLRRPVALPL